MFLLEKQKKVDIASALGSILGNLFLAGFFLVILLNIEANTDWIQTYGFSLFFLEFMTVLITPMLLIYLPEYPEEEKIAKTIAIICAFALIFGFAFFLKNFYVAIFVFLSLFFKALQAGQGVKSYIKSILNTAWFLISFVVIMFFNDTVNDDPILETNPEILAWWGILYFSVLALSTFLFNLRQLKKAERNKISRFSMFAFIFVTILWILGLTIYFTTPSLTS